MNLLLCLALAVQVPQPKLGATSPTGARAGTSVDVKITSGSDLERADRMVFSHPGIKGEPVMLPADRFFPEQRPVEGLFKVSVAADVPPGIYEVRASGQFGMSNSRRFVVGSLEELVEKEPNGLEAAQAIPVGSTVNGACDAQGFDVFRFDARKGQRLIVDCQAQRIDSRAQAVVLLYGPSGRRLHRAASARERDPLLDFTVEEDGAHTLRVHDAAYRGGDEHFYRLTLSAGPWIDFADPPVLKAGTESDVVLYGRNLPGGTLAEGVSIDGRPLEKLSVRIKAPSETTASDLAGTAVRPADTTADLFAYQLRGPSGTSNVLRLLAVEEPPVRETEPEEEPAKAKPVALPFHVLGRLYPAGDRDAFLFDAKKGEKLWIEIVSQRLGLPADPALTIQQVTDGVVKDLQDVDDSAAPAAKMGEGMEKRYRFAPEDPAVLWTAPADGRFRVLVRDLYGGGTTDPRYFYRLSIRPARPDFRLVAFPIEGFMAENKMNAWSCVLRRGGAERVRVIAYRREGFDGPIRLEAEDLPPGVSTKPVLLAPGEASGEFILQAAPDAARFAGAFRIAGKAEIDGKSVTRPARGAEIVWNVADTQKEGLITRVTDRLGIAVDDRFTAPLTAKLGGDAPLRMCRGGKLKVPVKLVKNADFKDSDKAKVKLTPVGIPGGKDQKAILAKEVTLEVAKPNGEIEIDITDKAPIGISTFYVAGDVQVPFAKMPERVKSMEVDKKRVEEEARKIADEIKSAEKARSEADAKAKEAAKALEAARQKLEKSKKDQAPDAAEAEKAVAELEGKAKEADAARAKATEAEARIKELAKAADSMTKKLTDDMKKVADAAKEKPVKVWVASLPVSIEVVAFPAALQAPAAAAVKAGDKVELAARLVRDCGFADEVKLELDAPKGSGLKLADGAAIAKDQAEGKIVLTAEKDAKPAKHTVTLRGKLTFHGKPFTVEQSFAVEVQPAPPPPPAPEPAKPAAEPKSK